MLWNRAYQTDILADVPFPDFYSTESDQGSPCALPLIIAGGVGPAGIPAATLWMRLISTLNLGEFKVARGLYGWSLAELKEIETYLTVNQITSSVTVSGSLGELLGGHTSFCAVIRQPLNAEVLYIGPATEEATDHLQAALLQ